MEMTMSDEALKYENFENLVINNDTFREIEAYLNRFNPIRVMKMEEMEIRHSSILGWLLDPRENHSIGDGFLKAFLAEALREKRDDDSNAALKIASGELSDAEVFVEWNKIDIFIKWPSAEKVFIIENKINSRQSKDQLKKYWKLVEDRFPDYEIHGVFLTLNEEEPHDDRYNPISYQEVLNLLTFTLKFHTDSMSPNIKQFIEHYRETVSRICGMDKKEDEMAGLARDLYRDNKKVLDFIFEQATNNEFPAGVEKFLSDFNGDSNNTGTEHREFFVSKEPKGSKEMYKSFKQSVRVFSFLPVSWIEAMGEPKDWKLRTKWWEGFPLICWVQIQQAGEKNILKLYAELGPLENHTQRKLFLSNIEGAKPKNASPKTKAIKFRKDAWGSSAKYSKFISDSEVIDNVNDAEEIRGKIEKLIKRLSAYSGPVKSAIESAIAADHKQTGNAAAQPDQWQYEK